MAQIWSMKAVLAQVRIVGGPAKLTKNATTFHKAPIYYLVKGFCTSTNGDVFNGANIYKDGQDPLLRPDSEYPDWLWTLNGTKTPLSELSTDENIYWRRVRKAKIKQQNALRKQGKLR
eukprot:Seg2229.1 transcript_id=Seg2229.1/GoldUCD/mRNA.D3Y31 product="39S ribosomal protein L54 mitochondrial" pseudo=true protein_id=Seg2229.1/GoldUCD/D3Y31